MDTAIEVQYGIEDGTLPSANQLICWAKAALADRRPNAEMTIRIVDEAEMADYNARYRGKEGPTNVLSFDYEPMPGVELPLIGDLLICATVVEREALQQNKTSDAHWAHIVIHGTLHLLGFDHVEPAEAIVMETLETTILAQLGYSNPYLED